MGNRDYGLVKALKNATKIAALAISGYAELHIYLTTGILCANSLASFREGLFSIKNKFLICSSPHHGRTPTAFTSKNTAQLVALFALSNLWMGVLLYYNMK